MGYSIFYFYLLLVLVLFIFYFCSKLTNNLNAVLVKVC